MRRHAAPPKKRRVREPLEWLRRRALALPGTVEAEAWGHPNFKAGGRTVAAFEIWKGRPSIALLADPEEQDVLIARFGFFRTPYAGKRGWASVWVDEPAAWDVIEELLRRAHRRACEKPRTSRGRRRPR